MNNILIPVPNKTSEAEENNVVKKISPSSGHVRDKIRVFETLAQVSEQAQPEGRVRRAIKKIETRIFSASFHQPVEDKKNQIETSGTLADLINRNSKR